jgi:hypothetical protein
MMLTSAFTEFVQRWLSRADEIQLASLSNYFDKFFTLFVAYNRLYDEAAFIQKNQCRLEQKDNCGGDKKAATCCVAKLIGTRIIAAIDDSPEFAKAICDMKAILEKGEYAFVNDHRTGQVRRDKDMDLLHEIQCADPDKKAMAILNLIYSIRCNAFHGQCGFEEGQKAILGPAIVLLEKITEVLFEKIIELLPNNPRFL